MNRKEIELKREYLILAGKGDSACRMRIINTVFLENKDKK